MTTELCFTGDIMCQMELTAACRKDDGTLDYTPISQRMKSCFQGIGSLCRQSGDLFCGRGCGIFATDVFLQYAG